VFLTGVKRLGRVKGRGVGHWSG